MDKWKKIGVVGVDSGQLMVCDPCYIDSEWEKEDLLKFLQSFGFKILRMGEFEELDKQKSWIWVVLKKHKRLV